MKEHSRECHKCPFDGKGADECIRCQGPSDALHRDGKDMVSLDALGDHAAACGATPETDGQTDDIRAAARTVAALLCLSPLQMDAVCLRFQFESGYDRTYTYPRIAQILGVSKQAVEKAHREALVRWRPLRSMFRGKSRRAG